MNVTGWPTSTGFCVAVGTGTARAGSTANESAELVTVFAFVSVTATVTENGDPVVVLGVQVIVTLFVAVQPEGRPDHAYVL